MRPPKGAQSALLRRQPPAPVSGRLGGGGGAVLFLFSAAPTQRSCDRSAQVPAVWRIIHLACSLAPRAALALLFLCSLRPPAPHVPAQAHGARVPHHLPPRVSAVSAESCPPVSPPGLQARPSPPGSTACAPAVAPPPAAAWVGSRAVAGLGPQIAPGSPCSATVHCRRLTEDVLPAVKSPMRPICRHLPTHPSLVHRLPPPRLAS